MVLAYIIYVCIRLHIFEKMIIANKYKIIEKIGEGCFGFIFKGENIRTFEKVAIKMESISCETNLLKNEAKIYQYLKGCNHNG